MAIDTWITATLNPSAAKIPDNADHKNKTTPASADGGSVTVAWDSAVITSLSLLKSCLANILQQAAGKLPQ